MSQHRDPEWGSREHRNAVAAALANGECIAESTHGVVDALFAFLAAERAVDPWVDDAQRDLPTVGDLVAAYARGADHMRTGEYRTQAALRTEAVAALLDLLTRGLPGHAAEYGVKIVHVDGTVRYDTSTSKADAVAGARALHGTPVVRAVGGWVAFES